MDLQRGYYVLAFNSSNENDLVYVWSLVNGKKVLQPNGQRSFNNEWPWESLSIQLMDVKEMVFDLIYENDVHLEKIKFLMGGIKEI